MRAGECVSLCCGGLAIPISYAIDEELGIIRTRGRGLVTARDLVDFLGTLLADPAVPQPIRDLHDLRRVEEFDIRAQDVRAILELSQRDPGRIRDGRVAVIATQDYIYGMSRMLAMLAEFSPVAVQLREQGLAPVAAVFRDPDPALQWLISEGQESAA